MQTTRSFDRCGLERLPWISSAKIKFAERIKLTGKLGREPTMIYAEISYVLRYKARLLRSFVLKYDAMCVCVEPLDRNLAHVTIHDGHLCERHEKTRNPCKSDSTPRLFESLLRYIRYDPMTKTDMTIQIVSNLIDDTRANVESNCIKRISQNDTRANAAY